MIVDAQSLFLNSTSQGNKQLTNVKSLDIDDDSEVETVNTATAPNKRPVGFREKQGGIKVTLEELVVDEPEANWRRLKIRKEEFSLTVQLAGGDRWQLIPCRVSKVAFKGDDAGEIMQTIEIVALDWKDN